MSLSEERLRILKLIENGLVSAEEGARLIDAIGEAARERPRTASRPQSLRVIITDLVSRRQKLNVMVPVGLVNVGLKLGARFFPRMSQANAEDIMRAIEVGAPGRFFELQDLEEGERIEIFVE
ncbi:MAG TPA: hypothetical protein PKA05_07130 [Roseiflexaceae bacterium]|nr:hypothetical protein [Roseiflexaceae bacterium]HMP40135.1 hypothetical protein [Roseiflexaceae bacterium]